MACQTCRRERGDGTVSVLLGNGDGTFQRSRRMRSAVNHRRWRWRTSTATASPTWSSPTAATARSACCWATATAPSSPRQTYAVGVQPDSVAVGGPQRRRQAGPGRRQLRRQQRQRAAGQRRRHVPGRSRPTPSGTVPTRVAVADLNGDGKPDLVVANYGDNNVSVLLGNGDGTFQTAADLRRAAPARRPSRWRT